jgi:hypothetical protein
MNNSDLATQLVKLLSQVNAASYDEDNTIDYKYSRDDSIFGKLSEALEMIAPEAHLEFMNTGDCPNQIIITNEKV